MEVDLSAALIVLSSEEADRRDIPLSQRVSILGVGAAKDAWAPCERPSFSKSPAIAAAATAAFDHANMPEGAAGVDKFDLYSCFPSAVQMGLHALGVEPDDPRGVTVTGGLAYAGGPGNSYAVHSLAAMTEVIRVGDARVGLVSGLGMAASKHAVAVLSNDPRRIEAADGGFHYAPVAPELTCGPLLVDGVSGIGTVETYTVEYQRDGSVLRTMFVVRLDDGTRTVANGTADPAEVRAITEHEGVGRRCAVVGGTPPAVALPDDYRLGGVDLGEPNRVSLV
jgi:acetyl-CoA C-acetyltransferase